MGSVFAFESADMSSNVSQQAENKLASVGAEASQDLG